MEICVYLPLGSLLGSGGQQLRPGQRRQRNKLILLLSCYPRWTAACRHIPSSALWDCSLRQISVDLVGQQEIVNEQNNI
jgi:hypothetical protein